MRTLLLTLKKMVNKRFTQSSYGFINQKYMSKENYTSHQIPFPNQQKFLTTTDTKNIAHNHCGAVLATNLWVHSLPYPLPVSEQVAYFKIIHSYIGDGPVVCLESKIRRFLKREKQSLATYRTKNQQEIKASLQLGLPLALLLAKDPLNWHWVMAVGYREYKDGTLYLQVVTGWHQKAVYYYPINQTSKLVLSKAYEIQ